MEEFSDIIDKLIAEEKLGILHSIASVSQEDLELPEKLSEETIDESTIIRGKYFDHDESNIKLTPDSDSLEGNLTNVNGNYFNTNHMKNLKKNGNIVKHYIKRHMTVGIFEKSGKFLYECELNI